MLAPEATATSVLVLAHAVVDPGLRAGDGGPRGLEDRPRVLEHVLDRGADLVGVHEHHLVHQLAAQAEGLAPDFLDRDAVGEQPDVRA